MPIYKVDSVILTRFRYVMEAPSSKDAERMVTSRFEESGEYFDEFSQKDLSEVIIDVGEITKEQFQEMNEALKTSRDEIGNPYIYHEFLRNNRNAN